MWRACAVEVEPARSTGSICWPLTQAYRAGWSKANARHWAGRFTDWPVRHQSEHRDEPVAVDDVGCVVAVGRGVATGVQQFDVGQVKAGAPRR